MASGETTRGVITQVPIPAGSSHPAPRETFRDAECRLLLQSVNASGAALCVTDGETRILYVNEAFARLSGYSRAEMLGQPVRQFLVSDRISEYRFRKAVKKIRLGQTHETDLLLTRRNGQRLWAHLDSSPVFDPDGAIRHMVTVLTDITRAKLHEVLQCVVMEALVREQPLDHVMNLLCREIERMAPDAIASVLRVDRDGMLHPLAGPSLPAHYLRSLDGMPSGPMSGSCGTAAFCGEAVLATDVASDPRWVDYRELALAQGLRACWSVPVHHRDGRVVATFALYFRNCRGPDPLHSQLLAIGTHLCLLAIERDEAHRHIRQMAFYDSLTGLPNRSQLLSRASQMLVDMAREQAGLAVLFVDLDRFKQVNDALGHACGDELLRIVAERLRSVVRDSDLVGRLSGDEFVLVLPRCSVSHVAAFLERLRATLSVPARIGDTTMVLSASVGVSLFPRDGSDMTSLLRHADTAMYQAKRVEHGSFSFFSPP